MTSKQINAFLRDAIPADPTKQTVITHIPKEKVQSVIDTAWERLDDKTNLIHPTLTPSSQSALLRKLCLKLAATHDVLPTSFYVEDVVCLNLEAVDAGAYADILQGQYNGRLVILKRPRIPNPRMKDKVMMVCLLRSVEADFFFDAVRKPDSCVFACY
ncbi:hypothetical protein BXZ70DRAFT_109101 [Cristinia sonorae]|uniref:Uncharacterized protein n=1 Tax=Cristinia sonorae TaxID=1940300 RepID=A0A8K0XQV3_9AGAR|nr:hypothetical protein BXZ70DRAFT_109101 [Cristinia sonorae]